jgi:hypothetical protein
VSVTAAPDLDQRVSPHGNLPASVH